MNTTAIAFTTPSATYAFKALSYQLNDPRTISSTAGGQILKKGYRDSMTLSITTDIDASLYNFFYNAFLNTWNDKGSNYVGTLTIEYLIADRSETGYQKRIFENVVVTNCNMISQIKPDTEVTANLTFSLGKEKGFKYNTVREIS